MAYCHGDSSFTHPASASRCSHSSSSSSTNRVIVTCLPVSSPLIFVRPHVRKSVTTALYSNTLLQRERKCRAPECSSRVPGCHRWWNAADLRSRPAVVGYWLVSPPPPWPGPLALAVAGRYARATIRPSLGVQLQHQSTARGGASPA